MVATQNLGSGRVWLASGGNGGGGAPPAATASLPDPPAAPVVRAPRPPDGRASSSRLAPFTVEPDAFDSWPLTREQVWLIPAVAQGLQVIAGTIGTLPLERRRGLVPLELGTLFEQPDPEEPRESTFTRLVEDLVLFPTAYMVVIERDRNGFPLHARYVPAELVEPADDLSDVGVALPGTPRRYRIGVGAGVLVDARDVIRFPSHWPGLLVVGARALRTAQLLELAAQRFAVVDMPTGTLKNTGADLPPEKVDELLATWEQARRTRSTAYLNALIDYEVQALDANAIQLIDARRWSTAEVARLLNLPSRYLNAPADSGSMTYSNVESARRDLVDLSLRPYLSTVEKRSSMDDVCPHGQTVAFELDAFYRGDLNARGAYYTQALNGAQPWMTVDEVRASEGDPPIEGTDNGDTPTVD